jgi:hypothetical protein
MDEQRKSARRCKRRIIYNNDGDDIIAPPGPLLAACSPSQPPKYTRNLLARGRRRGV